MKFLCLECDEVMGFAERQLPGDGTLAAVFTCPSCSREMAMLTNPMETQFVSSMGIKIGGAEIPSQPMESIRTSLDGGREGVFVEGGVDAVPDTPGPSGSGGPSAADRSARTLPVEWSPDAVERLGKVPSFVRGMVKRIYTDYARERGIRTITPAIMDTARAELGLEGM